MSADEMITADAELEARYYSEIENAVDLGMNDEAARAYAEKATIGWDKEGRPE